MKWNPTAVAFVEKITLNTSNSEEGLRNLRELLQEAGRRHVARVAVLYAAVAFAVLEAADIVIPVLGWGEWSI